MKKKSVVFLIIAAVLLIGSISLFSDNQAGGGVFFLACAAVCAFFALRRNKVKDTATASYSSADKKPRSSSKAPSATLSDIPGHTLRYHYNDVKIAGYGHYDKLSARVGSVLTLTPEPTNEHDAKAVAVLIDGKKLGYLPANRLQAMYYDFISRGGTVVAKVFASGKDSVDMLMGFYACDKAEYDRLISSGAPCKTFRLTANTNSEMQENIGLLEVGEPVDYLYDYEKEKYSASAFADIGFFPASANDLLEVDTQPAYVSRIEENDNGKLIVFVDVFLKQE